MSDSLFIQIHALRTHTNVLLNRNDVGEPKTCRIGGVRRTRVSSQCRKYHWRKYDGPHAIRKAGQMSVRSRQTFRERIAQPLIEDGHAPELVSAVVNPVKGIVLNDDDTKNGRQGKDNQFGIFGNAERALEAFQSDDNDDPLSVLHTEQVIVLGEAEVGYLQSLCNTIIKDVKDADPDDIPESVYSILKDNSIKQNLSALGNAMGIDAAMHGRMVTSDALSQGDAAVHVAHAFTTHEHLQDSDYFATTDDFVDQGSGHINQKELTSGTFYEYAVVDFPLLVANLEGCSRNEWTEQDLSLTREVLRRFIHTCAELAPGAKKSSTAPYATADFLLVEVGQFQPHAVSFERPVSFEGGALSASIERIDETLAGIDQMYDPEVARGYATTTAADLRTADAMTLSDLADFAEETVMP